MNNTDIENEILKCVYDWWERHGGSSVFYILRDLKDVDEVVFTRIAREMEEKFLIDGVGQSMRCEITAHGINEAEKRALIPREKFENYQDIRYLLISAAALALEERGLYEEILVGDLIAQLGLNETDVFNNARFLSDAGLLKFSNAHYFRVTESGLEHYKKWTFLKSLEKDFANISQRNPNVRGIQFQGLIAKALGNQEWNSEESVRTSYEEVDIFINRDSAYYLIECKWTRDPTSPEATSHLLAKLNRRDGTRGILMSMSGFTSGAVESVEDAGHHKIILLFGKNDIEEIINNPASFDTLLEEKERQFITRRNAVWS
jgi:hypothetical protein